MCGDLCIELFNNKLDSLIENFKDWNNAGGAFYIMLVLPLTSFIS